MRNSLPIFPLKRSISVDVDQEEGRREEFVWFVVAAAVVVVVVGFVGVVGVVGVSVQFGLVWFC